MFILRQMTCFHKIIFEPETRQNTRYDDDLQNMLLMLYINLTNIKQQ